MAYDSNKASRGTKPETNTVADRPTGLKSTQSNQERGTGEGWRKVTPGPGVSGSKYSETNRMLSNQLRIGPNVKGTGTLKEPSAVALAGRDKVDAAVENPDGTRNRFPASGYAGNKAKGR